MLVNYPDSSSESDHDHDNELGINPTRKRKAETELRDPNSRKLPPLPSNFHSLYAAATRTSTADDPSLHAGRTRQVPHVVGNWPTHVYLEWYPSPSGVVLLEHIISQVAANTTSDAAIPHKDASIHTFLRSDLGALLPLHISLSAPLVVRTEQKSLFEDSLGAQLKRFPVSAFTVDVVGLDWVSNHDDSRYFLVLRLSQPVGDQLNKLLDVCNTSAREFALTQLYPAREEAHVPAEKRKAPKIPDSSGAFHISVAWTLQKPTEGAIWRLAPEIVDRCRGLEIRFDILKLKMGNTVLDILLDKGDGGRRSPASVRNQTASS